MLAAMRKSVSAEQVALGLHPCCARFALQRAVQAVAHVIGCSRCSLWGPVAHPIVTSDCLESAGQGHRLPYPMHHDEAGDCCEQEGVALLRGVGVWQMRQDGWVGEEGDASLRAGEGYASEGQVEKPVQTLQELLHD